MRCNSGRGGERAARASSDSSSSVGEWREEGIGDETVTKGKGEKRLYRLPLIRSRPALRLPPSLPRSSRLPLTPARSNAPTPGGSSELLPPSLLRSSRLPLQPPPAPMHQHKAGAPTFCLPSLRGVRLSASSATPARPLQCTNTRRGLRAEPSPRRCREQSHRLVSVIPARFNPPTPGWREPQAPLPLPMHGFFSAIPARFEAPTPGGSSRLPSPARSVQCNPPSPARPLQCTRLKLRSRPPPSLLPSFTRCPPEARPGPTRGSLLVPVMASQFRLHSQHPRPC